MHPAQRLEKLVVETLNSNRQAVDAERTKLGEFLAFESAGIRFERDLDRIAQLKLICNAFQQTVESFRRKQARRAAADKNAMDRPGNSIAPDILGQIAKQRIDISRLGRAILDSVGIEIAIRTFFDAPWNVHVKAERGQRIRKNAMKGTGSLPRSP